MIAAFILSINLFVAALFALAFFAVSSTNPTAHGARWLAAAYALGVLVVALEFMLPWLANPTLVVLGIYTVYLVALTLGLIGVSQHYCMDTPKVAIGIVWLAGLAIAPVMLALPYGSVLRTTLYQLPYASIQVLMTITVLRSQKQMPLDKLLIAVSGVAALTYLVKPLIAWKLGTATGPQAYITTEYAAISQTMGSVVLIALALVMLLVMMRDVTIEMVARSETDFLSGVLNRRGFQVRGEQAVAEAIVNDSPLTLVTVDFDRFKAVNDGYGYTAGDALISDLAKLLSRSFGSHDIVARLGGDEFAILLPGRKSCEAMSVAEDIRVAISRKLPMRLDNMKAITASFGVAELQPGDQLSDLCRRSDWALYTAKDAGRNRVSGSHITRPDATAEGIRDRRVLQPR